MSDQRSPGSPGPPSSGGPWLIPHDSWFHSENDPSMLSIEHYRCIIFSSSIFQKQKRQSLWLAVVGVQTLIARCCIDDTWPYNVIVDSCNTQCLSLSDKDAKEHIIIYLILGSFGLLLVGQKKKKNPPWLTSAYISPSVTAPVSVSLVYRVKTGMLLLKLNPILRIF